MATSTIYHLPGPLPVGYRPRPPQAPNLVAPQLPTSPRPPTAAPVGPRPPATLTPAQRLASLTPTQKTAFQQWTAHASANGPIAPQGLSSGQLAQLQTEENTTNDAYRNTLAEYEFARGNEGATYGTNLDALTAMYDRQRQGLPESYVGRGLLNSGVYGQGLTDYSDARTKALAQLLMQHQQNSGQLDLQRDQAERTRTSQLSSIAAQRAAAIQALAAQLQTQK